MHLNPLLQSVQLALQNATQVGALAYVDEIHKFISSGKYGEVLDDWEPELVRLLIAYHLAKDTLLCERDEDGKIAGIVMWYTCNSDDTFQFIADWEPDREGGDSVFLAFLYASSTKALKKLTLSLIEKEPSVLHKKLIGLRMKHGNVPTRMDYTQKLFSKILSKKD